MTAMSVRPRRLTRTWRRVLVTLHVALTAGWLGASMVMLTLAIAARASQSADHARSAYWAMHLLGGVLLIPLSLSVLLTGVLAAATSPRAAAVPVGARQAQRHLMRRSLAVAAGAARDDLHRLPGRHPARTGLRARRQNPAHHRQLGVGRPVPVPDCNFRLQAVGTHRPRPTARQPAGTHLRKEQRMKAVVTGGLAAAVALRHRGADVAVLERDQQPNPGGAALTLWPNALRCLDQLGVGGQLRRHAALGGDSGIRRPDGRWLARTRLGQVIEARFGDPLVIVRRATLTHLLAEQLPPGTIRYSTKVTGAQPGGTAAAATVHTSSGSPQADLIVAADGIRCTLRTALFPGIPGPRYAGYTAWRMIVSDPGGTEPAETWGPDGQRFAILPIGDGQCYCYATADVPAGPRSRMTPRSCGGASPAGTRRSVRCSTR